MRYILLIAFMALSSCSWQVNNEHPGNPKVFTEAQILDQLDLAFNGVPSEYYPAARPQDIKYNFFLDLEHGYCLTAGNKIHLYGDSTRWAIVFEKSGYQNRGDCVEIELNYVGNCITYPIDTFPERNYITNSDRVILIDQPELERIENKNGTEWKHLN